MADASSGNQLHDLQALKERDLSNAADRIWNTARYPGEIDTALNESVPQRILVLGCGVDECAQYADALPDAQIVGVDVSQAVIDSAEQGFSRGNTQYQLGDILDDDFAETLEPGSFGAIVMTGLLTNIVDPDATIKLFQRVDTLLAQGGRVIISDYLIFESWIKEWTGRYLENLYGLADAGLVTPAEFKLFYGAFVTRPRQLPAAEAVNLNWKEIGAAVRAGDFERIVRHWDPYVLASFITLGSRGRLQVHHATIGNMLYDPALGDRDLGWLRPICLVLEKRQDDLDAQIEHLQHAAAAEPYSYQAFFDRLSAQ